MFRRYGEVSKPQAGRLGPSLVTYTSEKPAYSQLLVRLGLSIRKLSLVNCMHNTENCRERGLRWDWPASSDYRRAPLRRRPVHRQCGRPLRCAVTCCPTVVTTDALRARPWKPTRLSRCPSGASFSTRCPASSRPIPKRSDDAPTPIGKNRPLPI